jgi:uncharacterized protein (DUF2336 family)
MAAGRDDAPLPLPTDAVRCGRKALDIAYLCTLAPLSESSLDEIDPALTSLLKAAESNIRAQVALRLADCSWAPLEAVRFLAFDEVAVAAPVLERSPRLDEATLIEAAGCGRDHRRIIAGRARISAPVSAAISAYRETDCLRILAANAGAALGPACAPDFAAAARGDEALQDSLAARSDLHPAIARAVYAIAGRRVKAVLAAAMPDLDPGAMEQAVDEGLEAALDAGEDAAAETLAARLMAQRALGKGDVLRAACGGRDAIADHAIARLTGLPAADWRRALSRSALRTTLMAARSMAMTQDEAAALYDALAQAGRAHPLPPDRLAEACRDIYQAFARDDARKALHRLGAGASLQ